MQEADRVKMRVKGTRYSNCMRTRVEQCEDSYRRRIGSRCGSRALNIVTVCGHVQSSMRTHIYEVMRVKVRVKGTGDRYAHQQYADTYIVVVCSGRRLVYSSMQRIQQWHVAVCSHRCSNIKNTRALAYGCCMHNTGSMCPHTTMCVLYCY